METQQTISATGATTAVIENQVLYTAKVHITGGREGAAQSDDGRLDILLSGPGTTGKGTNPEQLLAAGWSACFIGAIKLNAALLHIAIPSGMAVDTEVDLIKGKDGYALQARLHVSLPGLTNEQANALVTAAHETCPYSKALHGNIGISFHVTV